MSIVEKTKFRRPVYPGDKLVYHAEVDSVNEVGGRTNIKAHVDGELITECSLVFTFHEFNNDRLESRRSEILSLWLNGVVSHETE